MKEDEIGEEKYEEGFGFEMDRKPVRSNLLNIIIIIVY